LISVFHDERDGFIIIASGDFPVRTFAAPRSRNMSKSRFTHQTHVLMDSSHCRLCSSSLKMTMIPPRSREAGSVGFTRQQSADFSLRPGGDGTTGSGSVDSDRYHPYHRQLSDARSHSARRQASSSPSSSSSSSSSSSWDRFNGSVQVYELI